MTNFIVYARSTNTFWWEHIGSSRYEDDVREFMDDWSAAIPNEDWEFYIAREEF